MTYTSSRTQTQTIDPIATARQVLATEADALHALAATLDGKFSAALDILAAATGRLVVTGMGKSGHVGRKIAATMASTGTPSQFVHPGEASHGDLGMIVAGDAVLALSNSGETSELADLIAHTRRFHIGLVAITARAESALARAADVALVLPKAPEACPMGLAPTTSTTMQLALGDALSVALLERRGFTPADFRVFHPGGRLGAQLTHVADLMHRDNLPISAETAPVADAIAAMSNGRFGCVGLVDGAGRLSGIITDGDLRRAMGNPDLVRLPAADVMTRAPRTIGVDTLAAEALHMINTHSITALFVLDDAGKPIGLLHVHDLLRAGVA